MLDRGWLSVQLLAAQLLPHCTPLDDTQEIEDPGDSGFSMCMRAAGTAMAMLFED